jgi:hypothetical protein
LDGADYDFVCVLRVTKRGAGLGALLRAHPRVKPDAAWKAGTRPTLGKWVGKVRKENGFNLCVAEGSGWKSVLVAIRRRLRALAPMIRQGKRAGASFQFDIGVMPGGEVFYLSTILPPKDLKLLADLGVELCVTSYPVSEEKEAAPRRGARAAKRIGRRGARPRGR